MTKTAKTQATQWIREAKAERRQAAVYAKMAGWMEEQNSESDDMIESETFLTEIERLEAMGAEMIRSAVAKEAWAKQVTA